jgi:hypothetical protein
MPWRFRRSVKILPGVHWNIGKKGSSWTFGNRGYKTTIGGNKVRRTWSLPGTGLSIPRRQNGLSRVVVH